MPAASDQLTTDRFPGEKTEAQHLSERCGAAYSLGHRRCYLGPIEMIADGERALSIIDVGSGIGWGYEQMAARLNLARYVGIERHADSVLEHRSKLKSGHDVFLASFLDAGVEANRFDYAFCIEVAEHIRAEFHGELFARIADSLKPGGLLFLSTPDASAHAHGNLTQAEAKAALLAAGFSSVVSITEHWTTLYVAEAAR